MRNGSRVSRWGRLFVLSTHDRYSIGMKLGSVDVVFLSVKKLIRETVKRPEFFLMNRKDMRRFLDTEKLPEISL